MPPAPVKVLLVDDEAPARARLREVLADCAANLPLEILGESDNGMDALRQVEEKRPDVLLLDIRMPEMDGIEVAMHLRHLSPATAVIFTTAYDNYASQAFEVNAVDYLMKPVRAERLGAALAKARVLSQAALDGLRQAHPRARSHISLNEKGRMVLVPVADILYLKAEAKYVTVKTAAREYLIEDSLVKLEVEFGDRFIRIHRNCLVARQGIREIGKSAHPEESHYLRLEGVPERLAVSRRQYSLLRDLLQ